MKLRFSWHGGKMVEEFTAMIPADVTCRISVETRRRLVLRHGDLAGNPF